ncbi:hypothetical protein L3V43_00065 [Pseudoalteromonas sp. L23]|uniref:hypothetical protein n=1 Tax=unclassified Pseudoalteromonas TaxID=194690 RepID=UPI001EEFD916|nr:MULTISPECIES: hypothetical protein [unclassified Pseudoalteromonas]MCF7512729.1 hypothetical protein [Pseudoalteromonas sp. L7]MCF7524057.1 hypothetical protein [Pseudoalteromonas sp. L23]MCX2769681.1 hypothetical protein [Pseudoalteromonas sp. B530]
MKLSKSKQYEYLDKLSYRELCEKYGESNLVSMFDLSMEEYVEWESKRPIGNFVNTSRDGYDGLYFLHENNVWKVFWQERKIVRDFDIQEFNEYLDARKYLAEIQAPIFIRRQAIQAPNQTNKDGEAGWLSKIARLLSFTN